MADVALLGECLPKSPKRKITLGRWACFALVVFICTNSGTHEALQALKKPLHAVLSLHTMSLAATRPRFEVAELDEETLSVGLLSRDDENQLEKIWVAAIPLAVVEVGVLAVFAAIQLCPASLPMVNHSSRGNRDVMSVIQEKKDTQGAIGLPKAPVQSLCAHTTAARTRKDAMLITSAPRWISVNQHIRRINQLDGRDGEMRVLLQIMPNSLHIVPAARFPNDVKQALQQVAPRVLIFSGHFYDGAFLAECGEQRMARPVRGNELVQYVMESGAEVVVLNGCKSQEMAYDMVRGFQEEQRKMAARRPRRLYVVYTDTVVTDDFAIAFIHELMATAFAEPSNGWPEIFLRSSGKFCSQDAAFCMGDPAAYHSLHTCCADHGYDRTCHGCNPPVHGRYKLIASK